MKFFLIVYIYAGMFAKGDSVALEALPMPTMAACQTAGNALAPMVKGTAKELVFVCVKAE